MNLLVYAKPVIQYANAIVLTIKEIAKAFAQTKKEIDGIDYEKEFASFGNSVEDTTEAVDELSKSLSLLALDKLNILGSSGTNVAEGLSVEGNILNALKEYKMNLDKVSYKAKEISERMMTWLGYSKVLNNETGEWDWKLGSGNTNLEKIKTTLLAIVGIFVGAKMTEGLASFVTSFAKVSKLLGDNGGIVATLSIVGAVIGGLYATNEEFRGSVNQLAKDIMSDLKPIIEDVSSLIGIIFDFIGEIAVSLMPIISGILTTISGVINKLEPIIQIIVDIIGNVLKGALEFIKPIIEVIGDVVETISPLIEAITDLISEVLTEALELIKPIIEKIIDKFGSVMEVIKQIIDLAIKPLKKAIESITTVVGAVVDTIKAIFEGDFSSITGIWQKTIDKLKDIWFGLGDKLKEIWKNVWDSIKGVFINIINGIIKAFSKFVNFFSSTVNDITGGLSNVWTWLGIPAIPEIPTWNPEPIAFANGGVITEPTNALMGEYANAKNNPEIVAPQSIMKETFLEAVTPLINAILQGDNNLLKALNDKETNVYLNGRKVSEAIYDDLGAVATRKGKVIFASNT